MNYLFAFLLIGSQALAATTVCIRTERRTPNGKETGRGSGVALGKTDGGYWVIITAKHVVKDAALVTVGIADKWVAAHSVYPIPTKDDVAFITLDSDYDFQLAGVAEDEAPTGESIVWSGYSNGTKFQKLSGKVTQTGFASCPTRPQHGQSGGGVYDQHGRLIGIVSGYDSQGNLVYEPIGRVRRGCEHHWGFFWGRCERTPPPVTYPPPPAQPPVKETPPPPEDEPAVAPPPVSVKPGKPSVDLSGIRAELAELRLLIGKAPRCQCKGKSCECDAGAIEARLKKLESTKIPVQITDTNGVVLDQAVYPLGSPIKLKLTPVKK